MQRLQKKSLKKLLRIKARYEKLQKVQKEMSMPLKSFLREKSQSQRPNLKVISQERLQPLNARLSSSLRDLKLQRSKTSWTSNTQNKRHKICMKSWSIKSLQPAARPTRRSLRSLLASTRNLKRRLTISDRNGKMCRRLWHTKKLKFHPWTTWLKAVAMI